MPQLVLEIVGTGHRNDIVAGVDEMYLARNPRRKARQQIEGRPADLLDGDRAPERRMRALEIEHEAGVGDSGAGERPDRPGGDRIDADLPRAEISGQVAHA